LEEVGFCKNDERSNEKRRTGSGVFSGLFFNQGTYATIYYNLQLCVTMRGLFFKTQRRFNTDKTASFPGQTSFHTRYLVLFGYHRAIAGLMPEDNDLPEGFIIMLQRVVHLN